jgi:hypothetical protein
MMVLGLSASTVKSWFQYRCERKTRYDMMTRSERNSATIVKEESGAAWALEGNKFEERVLARLRAEQPLLGPGPSEDRLGQAETIAFLRGKTKEKAATQLGLEQGPSFRTEHGLPEQLQINRSYTDIVFRESGPEGTVFRIVDIKATRSTTPFHKAQVAFYALLLRGMLADLGIDATVDATGAVWHIRHSSRLAEGLVEPATFELKPYLRLVQEFLKRDVLRIAERKVFANLDETFFHIYFKCEQCDYLGHCRKVIEHSDPADNDVSAVPGVSHQGKLALQARGLKTVRMLEQSAGIGSAGPTSWSLQRRSETIIARAGAIAANEVRRLPGVMSYLMPPRIDRAFYLLADHDAVEDNLVTIAYMRRGGAPRSIIRVIDKSSPDAERQALLDVFVALIADLGEIDAHNEVADPDQQLQAHIFIYEPAEARAIQAAIGRQLNDPQIRNGLLHAVRLFPPEDVVPEPEFKGAHHLPATAIRSVIEQLYALPTIVSYDLRQVSESLKAAEQIDAAYAPVGKFRRDFSSLLAMEAIRSLREARRDAVTIAEIEEDVRARLDTSARLVDWLTSQNTAAQTPFLRLKKQPFRFQSTLNPLNAGDLDLLHAYELMESRSALLETLVRLAQPARVRQQRGECLAGLTLETEGRHAYGRRWLRFSIPTESRDAEISPEDIGLILTDDNPDLRLNPANWRPLEIRFKFGDYGTLFVNMSARQYDSSIMASLRRQTGPQGWCIDKTHRDINGPRVQNFLLQLSSQL